MQLPGSLRVELLDEIDQFLQAASAGPEALTQCVLDLLETFGDEQGIDDICSSLEDSGGLEAPLQESLENEFTTNENFHETGEDAISVIEQLCGIDWIDDADFDDLEELDEEEF